MKSEAHILLEIHLKELGLCFEPEYQFHGVRKWRFDYLLWSKGKTGVEIEGGVHSRGRHTRGVGYEKDLEKYNTATAMGYRVYRFSTGQVLRGEAREFIKEHCL